MYDFLFVLGLIVGVGVGWSWLAAMAYKSNGEKVWFPVLLLGFGLLISFIGVEGMATKRGYGVPGQFAAIVEEGATIYKIVQSPKIVAIQKENKKIYLIESSSVPENILDKLEGLEGKEFIKKGDEIFFK